jgi:hypothetical protein
MIHNKPLFLTTFSLLLFYSCWLQTTKPQKKDQMKFEKLIFHSRCCTDTCPKISLQINNNHSMIVNRSVFTPGNRKEAPVSEQFKGMIPDEKFNELLRVLQSSNYENLPTPDVYVCNGVVITLIVYCDGKRKQLQLFAVPEEASELFSFLYKIDKELPLTRTKETIKLEE